jgi:hypothetical protein
MLKKALKALRDELRVAKQKQLKKQPSAKVEDAPVRPPADRPQNDLSSRYVPRWMEREVRNRRQVRGAAPPAGPSHRTGSERRPDRTRQLDPTLRHS